MLKIFVQSNCAKLASFLEKPWPGTFLDYEEGKKRFQSIAAALTYAENTLHTSAGVCFVEEVGGYTSMINKSVMRVGCLCNTLKNIQTHDNSLWLKEMASTVSAWLKLKNCMITNICFQTHNIFRIFVTMQEKSE